MTLMVLGNVLAYSEQLAVLIAVAALLAAVLKLTSTARLHCFQMLLAVALLLPFLQPWRVPMVNSTVRVSSTPLSNGASEEVPRAQWTPSLPDVAAGILAAGVLVRLGMLALGMFRLRRYLDNARLVPTAFSAEKERVGVWPDVFLSAELKGPVTFGLFRPAILVPERWKSDPTVAYHELLHVQRRDWGFTTIEELVRALLWFHPAVWWLIGQIQLAREEVVDRKVVQLMESREQYLDTLLAIAEAKAGLDLAPAPLFLKKRHLRQRVAALLKEVNMSRVRITSSLAGFAVMLAVAGWLAVRSFPLQAAPQSVKDAPGVTVQQDESKLLHRVPVLYPREALAKHIQGLVVVQATLNSNGEVTDAQVLSGPQELRKAALESVLQWHYNKERELPPNIQVGIEFTLPGGDLPVAAEPRPALAPGNSGVVQALDIRGVPPSLRDTLTGRLPVHVGDRVSSSDIDQLRNTVQSLDQHLGVAVLANPDGTLAIRISMKSPEPSMAGRIRVGGNAQALNLINKVIPLYPPAAKQSRLQGTVRFTAYIGKDGHIQNLELVSGHPLLAAAAEEAVRQWVYRPTLLNGDPVDVLTQIDVNFTLSE